VPDGNCHASEEKPEEAGFRARGVKTRMAVVCVVVVAAMQQAFEAGSGGAAERHFIAMRSPTVGLLVISGCGGD